MSTNEKISWLRLVARRYEKNGSITGIEAIKTLAWKAGALTIVLHLRVPPGELVSLIRIP